MEATASLSLTYDVNCVNRWSQRFVAPLEDLETFRIDPNGVIQEIG